MGDQVPLDVGLRGYWNKTMSDSSWNYAACAAGAIQLAENNLTPQQLYEGKVEGDQLVPWMYGQAPPKLWDEMLELVSPSRRAMRDTSHRALRERACWYDLIWLLNDDIFNGDREAVASWLEQRGY